MNQPSERVWTDQELAEYYDSLSDEELAAEDEAAQYREGYSWVQVPTELMPEIHRLLAAYNEQQQRTGDVQKKPAKRRTKR